MTLQILWFILIGVLFIAFFFLEGFDFGTGIATRLIGRTKADRDQMVATIAPVWDGNEVWLLTAGGAIFAAFPHWYATMFSGYYIPLAVVLLALIFRGVSFEFRHKMESARWQNVWDWALFVGSLLPPFLLGVLFTSMVKGMPIDANMNMHAGLFDYISLYSLVGGIAVTLLCLLHGLNYISLRTLGGVREKAKSLAQKLYSVLYGGLVVFAVLTFFYTDFFKEKAIAIILILGAIVVLSLLAHLFVSKKREALAVISSGLTLGLVVILLFVGLYPRVMVSSIDQLYSMTIQMAASGDYTLKIMTVVTVCVLPFVLVYQAWCYYVFRKRISSEPIAHE